MARWSGCVLAVLFAAPACAEVSGSVTLLSDDRYRGVSLSDEAPTAQLAVAWDHGDGWYAGLQLTRVRLAYPDAPAQLQAVPYLGIVRVLRPGLNAEAGMQYSWFATSSHDDYPEFYVGLSGERVGARVSRAAHYLGQGAAWYAEVNGTYPLREHLHAIGHLGALRAGSNAAYAYRQGDGDRNRWYYDAAVGLALALAPFELQVTRSRVSGNALPGGGCAASPCDARDAWVLRLTRSW